MPVANLRSLARTLVLAALFAGAMSLPAAAHARLVASVPAVDAALDSMPDAIVLTFSEPVEPAFSKVELKGADQLPAGTLAVAPDPADPASIRVALPDGLPAGHYSVTWTVVAADGHKTTGSYSFDVK